MLIYSMAWAIVLLLADGSFHNLYPVISIVPRFFIENLMTDSYFWEQVSNVNGKYG